MSRQGKAEWSKPFMVKQITREDLFTAGFPRWQIAGLSDEEMNIIASQIGDSYMEGFFDEDLRSACDFVLMNKGTVSLIGELT